jgi:non-ribosomal peptide synthetase component F
VIGLLAILKSGGAYLPIDLAYPADRVRFMLEDAQAPVLLTQRKLAPSLPATNARVVYVEDVLGTPVQPGQDLNLPEVSGPDDLAYVIYTSGTTGKPKGSMITHRNVVRLFPSTEHWYGFNERDVWTLFHSSAFDFSVWEIWGALLYGGRVVVVPFMVSRSPEAFYELLAAEKVTVLNQTPSAFRQLMQAEESVGPRPLALRYVISAAKPSRCRACSHGSNVMETRRHG